MEKSVKENREDKEPIKTSKITEAEKNDEFKNVDALKNIEGKITPEMIVSAAGKSEKRPKQKNGWVSFGLLLSIFAFILSMYNVIAKLSFLIVAFYYLILILILMLTFFVLLANENFNRLLGGGESLTAIVVSMQTIVPYTCSVAAVFSIAAIVMLSLQKKYSGGKKVTGIVFSVISLIISVIVLLVHYSTVIG